MPGCAFVAAIYASSGLSSPLGVATAPFMLGSPESTSGVSERFTGSGLGALDAVEDVAERMPRGAAS